MTASRPRGFLAPSHDPLLSPPNEEEYHSQYVRIPAQILPVLASQTPRARLWGRLPA